MEKTAFKTSSSFLAIHSLAIIIANRYREIMQILLQKIVVITKLGEKNQYYL
jgi:hypothetical protein